MSSQMKDLARRAVACKHWRWMQGMCLYLNGVLCRIASVGTEGIQLDKGWASRMDLETNPKAYPDLTDPATLGCLVALVREAWGDPSLCANDAGNYDLMFWHVYTGDQFVSIGCETEAEALVAALEVAP